jgi:hypothetical protein
MKKLKRSSKGEKVNQDSLQPPSPLVRSCRILRAITVTWNHNDGIFEVSERRQPQEKNADGAARTGDVNVDCKSSEKTMPYMQQSTIFFFHAILMSS